MTLWCNVVLALAGMARAAALGRGASDGVEVVVSDSEWRYVMAVVLRALLIAGISLSLGYLLGRQL